MHIAAFVLAGLALARPAVVTNDSLPACAQLVDGLARKIESNYAGFVLEYGGAARRAYERRRDALRARAGEASGDRCYFVLRALTDFFGDPHLFVFQQTYLDTNETRRRVEQRALMPRISMSEADVRARLARRANADPIEGIWRDGAMRLAIVPEPSGRDGRFLAVVLTSDTAHWTSGDVRGRFTRRADGGYDGELTERNLALRFPIARVHRRVLLRLSPGIWGKEFPVAAADSGQVDPLDAHRATLVWRGRTPVLSIPSHDPTYRGVLDTLLEANRDSILGAGRLIVDVRGNEGGSSWVTQRLVAMIVAGRAPRPASGEEEAQILSSEDQVAYVRVRWPNVSPDSASSVRLLARMTANPGKLVPVSDSIDRAAAARDTAPAGAPLATDATVARPLRVGVLVDGGTVSAAEVFVLQVMESPNVRTFGEPTEGALDYQSANIVRIGDTGRRWYLGYPTVAASAVLPRGGMRGKGIPPQVRVDWARQADAVGFVDRALDRPR